MSAPQHAADDSSLARSTGGAAARGAMLIALAVLIGLLLLAFALDDPDTEVTTDADDTSQSDDTDDDASTGDTGDDGSSTDDGTATTTTSTSSPPSTITTVPADEPLPPAEVSVLVANGTGEKGVAGAVSDKINARGYIALDAANAAAPTTESVIFYREGYAGNAVAIAEIIGTTADLVAPEPADGTIGVAQNAIDDGRLGQASVVVILGSDARIPLG